jgi:hypothetical protein
MKIERRGFLGGILGLFGAAAVQPEAAAAPKLEPKPEPKQESSVEFWIGVAAQECFDRDLKPLIEQWLLDSVRWKKYRRAKFMLDGPMDGGYYLTVTSLSPKELELGKDHAVGAIKMKLLTGELTFMEVLSTCKRFTDDQKYVTLQRGRVRVVNDVFFNRKEND